MARRERYALVLFIAFAGSTHSATFAVLLGLGAAALLLSWLNAKLVPRAGLAPMTAALVLSAVMLLGANYIVSKTVAWTPGGYGLAFGRMLQDGIVTRYLNDHCPDAQLKLCPYRNELPLDADTFLWGKSVFDKLGRFAGLGDEMRTIVLGSLHDYPAMQVETALRATARQLVEVATGEGIVTTLWHTYGIIERYTPSVVPAMQAARQQHGEIGFAADQHDRCAGGVGGDGAASSAADAWHLQRRIRRPRPACRDFDPGAPRQCRGLRRHIGPARSLRRAHRLDRGLCGRARGCARIRACARAEPEAQTRKCFDSLRPCAW